jgi:uncharacterized membrane protein YobD (UPF0266 family)
MIFVGLIAILIYNNITQHGTRSPPGYYLRWR